MYQFGYNSSPFEWGPAKAWNVKRHVEHAGLKLAVNVDQYRAMSPPNARVDVVAHSAGALVVWNAMERGVKFDSVVFISPAMTRKPKWEEVKGRFKSLNCVFNSFDAAVIAGAAIPWHPFGLAGARGFKTKGKPGNVSNYRHDSFEGPFNHSDLWFDDGHADELAARIHLIIGGFNHIGCA